MHNLLDADRGLYRLVHTRLRSRRLDPVMVWFTRAGTKGALWLALAAGIFLDGSRHARLAAAASVAALLVAEGTINLVLKPAIRRRRPYEQRSLPRLLVAAPGPHSWPSAHAGSSLAAAAVLAYWYPLWGLVLIPVALAVGYSRIYVGVHYPLDVLAGMVVGLLCAVLAVAVAGQVGH